MPVLLLSIAVFIAGGLANGQTITTIAGGGPHNLDPLQTALDGASGLATDSAGNLYIGQGYFVWRVDKAGRLERVVGNFGITPSANNTPAIEAFTGGSSGIAIDASDNLFVNSGAGVQVRKIDASGNYTTVAATVPTALANTSTGAITTDRAGNVYIANVIESYSSLPAFTSVILKISPEGTVTTVAQLEAAGTLGYGSTVHINGLATNSKGDVYFSDAYSCTVQKLSGGLITVVAGTGTCGYNGDGGLAIATQLFPKAIAVDRSDNLYIAEATAVREVPAGQSTIKTVAGFGSNFIAVDGNQTIYLWDSVNLRVYKVVQGVASIVAGTGYKSGNGIREPAVNAYIRPYTLALDGAGSVLLGDTLSSSILRVSLSTGTLSKDAGSTSSGFSPDGTPASNSFISYPRSLVSWKGATYFVEDSRIRKISNGVFSTVVNAGGVLGSTGDGGLAINAQITNPAGIVIAANGDLYLAEFGHLRVVSAKTGIISTVANGVGSLGMALDGRDNLYYRDDTFHIRGINLTTRTVFPVAGDGTKIVREGVPATQTGLNDPVSIFADQSGNIFYADYFNYRVRRIDADTKIVTTVAGNGNAAFAGDGGPATQASFFPQAITIDPNANLYIADYSGRVRVTKVNACFFSALTPKVRPSGDGSIVTIEIRATDPSCRYTVSSDSPDVTFVSGQSGTGNGIVTFTVAANRDAPIAVNISGTEVVIPRASKDKIGFFQPSSGPLWVLNASGSGIRDSGDKVFPFAGQPGVTTVVGDWNADGHSKVGYSMNGFWVLDYNGNGVFDAGDRFFVYGAPGPGYTPVVGDWNGDGRTKVGFYNNGFWTLDVNGNGVLDAADPYFRLGNGGASESPVVGDWNGDQRTKAGVFSNGTWTLDLSGTGSGVTYNFLDYVAGDRPVVGDWSGDAKAKIGVYRSGSWYLDYNGNGKFDGTSGGDRSYRFGGTGGDLPVIGDWNGDGTSKIGTYNAGYWTLDLNGNGVFDTGDRATQYGGAPGDQPLIGRW